MSDVKPRVQLAEFSPWELGDPGVPPMGCKGPWRGHARVIMPNGATRYFERWFTQVQIDHWKLEYCKKILVESALRDAERYL